MCSANLNVVQRCEVIPAVLNDEFEHNVAARLTDANRVFLKRAAVFASELLCLTNLFEAVSALSLTAADYSLLDSS